VTWLLVAAGAVVALGAGVAIGARSARTATGGALVVLVFSPFLADPLPASPVLAFRIVAGALAAFLLLVAARRAGDDDGSPLGLAAAIAAAGAAFAVGLGATAVGLPSFGPTGALAAGLACLAVAIPPVTRAGTPFRLGTALVVLLDGGLLVATALVGTPPGLETLLAGASLACLAAAIAALSGSAASAGSEGTVTPDAARAHLPVAMDTVRPRRQIATETVRPRRPGA
jgi:hypothetical protein